MQLIRLVLIFLLAASPAFGYGTNNNLVASDNFTRANSGNLGANWTTVTGLTSSQIVSNTAEASALSTDCEQFWGANTFTADQVSEVTLGASFAAEAGTQFSLNLRYQAGANSGYRIVVSSGTTLTINKVVAGALTSLGSVGVTPAAGDIWTAEAAGSLLIVLQNGIIRLFTSDTTYTTGQPGFSQFTTVNVAHTQISNWNGFGMLQQDGIWAKKGTVVPALSGDYPGTRPQGQSNPSILLDSGCTLVSSPCYKMWFLAGHDVGYAESLDGLAWTRRGTDVITGDGQTPSVVKNGSTYHLYCVTPGASPTTIHHYTSSDGITWALQSSNVHSAAFYFSVVYIDPNTGTWYALFDTGGGASANQTNLATSSDGATWTDYGSNPVASNFWGIVKVTKVGNTFYAWGQTANPGQGSAAPGTDPGEGLRMQTTDFIHWTNPVHSAHHSQIFENVNNVNGGNYVSFPVDVSGKAILYATGSPQDTAGGNGGMFVISAATGPASTARIASANEDAFKQVASDNFQRPDENPLGNGVWSSMSGQGNLQIVSHIVEPTSNASSAMVYTGASFSNDQYSSITIGSQTSSFMFPVVRGSTGATTMYFAAFQCTTGSPCTGTISYRVAGSGGAISPTVTITPQVGDVLTLSAVGNVISFYQNGYLILQTTDTHVSSGNPGIGENPNSATLSNSQITAWAGGNANVLPNYVANSQVVVME